MAITMQQYWENFATKLDGLTQPQEISEIEKHKNYLDCLAKARALQKKAAQFAQALESARWDIRKEAKQTEISNLGKAVHPLLTSLDPQELSVDDEETKEFAEIYLQQLREYSEVSPSVISMAKVKVAEQLQPVTDLVSAYIPLLQQKIQDYDEKQKELAAQQEQLAQQQKALEREKAAKGEKAAQTLLSNLISLKQEVEDTLNNALQGTDDNSINDNKNVTKPLQELANNIRDKLELASMIMENVQKQIQEKQEMTQKYKEQSKDRNLSFSIRSREKDIEIKQSYLEQLEKQEQILTQFTQTLLQSTKQDDFSKIADIIWGKDAEGEALKIKAEWLAWYPMRNQSTWSLSSFNPFAVHKSIEQLQEICQNTLADLQKSKADVTEVVELYQQWNRQDQAMLDAYKQNLQQEKLQAAIESAIQSLDNYPQALENCIIAIEQKSEDDKSDIESTTEKPIENAATNRQHRKLPVNPISSLLKTLLQDISQLIQLVKDTSKDVTQEVKHTISTATNIFSLHHHKEEAEEETAGANAVPVDPTAPRGPTLQHTQ